MALKEILAKFGFEIDSKPLDKADKKADSFAKKVVQTFAAAAVVNGIRTFVTSTLAAGDAITDTSAALGVSKQALQAWTYAGGQVGASGEDMATAMKFLQKNAVDGAGAFKKLGVDVKDSAGNIAPVEDLMMGVAKGLGEVKNPAERTKLALELLGKGGSKLSALFSSGAEGVDEMMKRFKELGGGFSDEALEAMDGAGDAIADVELASTSLKGSLMVVLAPAIRQVANWIAKFTAELGKGGAMSTRLKSALIVLGVVAAVAGAAMLAPFAPFIVAVAAAYLLIQDFYTFMEGGDSVTGRVLDWVFGPGGGDDVRAKIKELTADVRKFVDDVASMPGGAGPWDYITEGLSRVGADLVKFVVEDIPAALSQLSASMASGTAGTGEKIVAGIIGGLAGFPANLYLNAKAAIAQFILGLVVGIKEGAAQVGAAASELASSGLLGPLGVVAGAIPGRAAGGPVNAGQGYIVGEKGPEYFVPRSSGTIVPNGGGAGGTNVQQTNSMTFNVSGGDARSAVPAMRSAMTSALSDERGALVAALAGA